eukprot:gene20863-21582_t
MRLTKFTGNDFSTSFASTPAVYPWIFFCYSTGAPLFLNHDILYATTAGVQQGDPLLGPVLFALVLHPLPAPILRDSLSLRVGAILDDVTFLGSPDSTLRALEFIRIEGPAFGLQRESQFRQTS